MRPGRGDITTTRRRQVHGLGDRVGHEHDGGRGLAADPEQLGLHVLARHLVERAERLVHQQQRRVRGQGSGDRDALLHAARELPRVVLGELGQLDQLEHLERARAAPGLVPALQLERQLDVLDDGPPVEQPGLLERHPVVLVQAGLSAPACRSRGPRRWWVRAGWRSAAAASTSRTRTARSARRTPPARSPGRCRRAPGPRSGLPALKTFESPRTSTAFGPASVIPSPPSAGSASREVDQRDEPAITSPSAAAPSTAV